MILKVVSVTALLALFASPALASGQLPDGTYQCMMDEHLQGEMIIAGNTYQGPAYDGQYDGTFPFTIVDNNIDLQGTKGIYEDPTIQFIGALLVIAAHHFHRVTGIGQFFELDAFDDAAAIDVEAGDDALGEHFLREA